MDLIEIERGMLMTMPGGWKMSQLEAMQPTTTYAEFKKEILSEIARCLNMPFAISAGNSSGNNYASGRLDHQMYFKCIRVEQAHLEAVVLDRILAAWLAETVLVPGLLAGAAFDRESLTAHTWFFVGHEHVDLSGLRIPAKSRPILRDHDAGRIVGHTETIEINGSSIRLGGIVSGSNEHAREVSESGDNGFPWQASIGASAQRMVFVDRGEPVEVNGRKFSGPLYLARQSTLREVSFVALGADDQTVARMAAGGSVLFNPIEVQSMQFAQRVAAQGFNVNSLTEQQSTSLRALFGDILCSGDPVGSRYWRNAMHHELLDDWDRIAELLEEYPVVGTHRRSHAEQPQIYPDGRSSSDWHFAGTFFWFRNRDVFATNRWREVWQPTDWGAEAWVGRMFPFERPACVAYDGLVDH